MWLFALFRGFCFAKITNNYLIIKELFASESAYENPISKNEKFINHKNKSSNFISRTGKKSIIIDSEKNRYLLASIPNSFYKINFSIYKTKNYGKLIIINPKTSYYKEIHKSLHKDSSIWEKLEFSYTNTYFSKIDTFKIYMENLDSSKMYLDDFQIIFNK